MPYLMNIIYLKKTMGKVSVGDIDPTKNGTAGMQLV
jgi:hypothetical protein